MSTKLNALKVAALSALYFFALTEPCYANPIAFNPGYQISWVGFAILVIAAPFVEARIIIGISRDRVKPGYELSRLFWVLVIVNVFTVAATQVFAYYIAAWSRTAALGYLAEILPIVVEFLILRWLFTGLHRSGMFPNKLSNKEVARITLLANLVTFLAGILFLVTINQSWGIGITPLPWLV